MGDSTSVSEALSGNTGVRTGDNYLGRNVKVLSAYGPLNLPGLRYAIIARIHENEALAPFPGSRAISPLSTGAIVLVVCLWHLFARNPDQAGEAVGGGGRTGQGEGNSASAFR